MKIPDKQYMDFSGGINRYKSPYLLKDNELQRGRNFEIDEIGRIKKRRGAYQFGQSISNIIALHNDNNGFYAANSDSTNVTIYRMYSSINSAAIAVADTSIAKPDTGFVAGPSTIEIEGDIINYAAGGGGASFTTVTNITSAHAQGRSINQWQVLTSSGGDGDNGVWFTYLNALTIASVYSGTGTAMFTIAGDGTVTAISGEPTPSRFLETFRDRVFCVNNNTVYYSNLGSAASWPATVADNSFDIEDQSGEIISAIKQYRKNLIICKPSATYAYPGSLPVRQLSNSFGVFNEHCLQEIGGLLYGFGPSGAFVTNGASFVPISYPIREYLKDMYFPLISGTVPISRIRTGQFEDKFIIYVNDQTEPDTDANLSQCMFVYHTKKKSWEIWDGLEAVSAMKYVTSFRAGNGTRLQNRAALFFASAAGAVFRAFDNRFVETSISASGTRRGGDVYPDMFSNTGTNITFEVLTKPYDLGYPNYKKKFGYLKVFSERPNGTNVAVVIDGQDPIPLGQLTDKISRFQFPQGTDGTRCAILFEENSQTQPLILNGVIFEDCATISKHA